jgi:hypothetical protein
MLGITKDIGRAKKDCGGLFPDRNKMCFHIEHLTERIVEELGEEHFLHVPASKAKYYKQEDLFGAEIGAKFSKFREDLTNAGTAYALGLNTACVFHLMRVMEHCVQRFGTRLKVPIVVQNETWANIMQLVNKAIEKLPGGPRAAPAIKATPAQHSKRQQMALAAGYLNHVRIVWRNDTMHPKATYDEQQALDVLNGVKTFLASIAKLV